MFRHYFPVTRPLLVICAAVFLDIVISGLQGFSHKLYISLMTLLVCIIVRYKLSVLFTKMWQQLVCTDWLRKL